MPTGLQKKIMSPARLFFFFFFHVLWEGGGRAVGMRGGGNGVRNCGCPRREGVWGWCVRRQAGVKQGWKALQE